MFKREKNIYKKASYSSAIITIVVCIMMLIIGITESIKGNSFPVMIVVLIIPVGAMSVYSLRQSFLFRKECEEFRAQGVVHEGVVIEKRDEDPSLSKKKRRICSYLVKYESIPQNKTIQFWTPSTSITFKGNGEIRCVVYEYNEKSYADCFWESAVFNTQYPL